MRKTAAILATTVLSLSGCQSDREMTGSGGFAAGESWAEQREKAASILARFSEGANRSSPPSDITPGMALDTVAVDPKTTRMKVTLVGAGARRVGRAAPTTQPRPSSPPRR